MKHGKEGIESYGSVYGSITIAPAHSNVNGISGSSVNIYSSWETTRSPIY